MTWPCASTGVGSGFDQVTLPIRMNEPSVGIRSENVRLTVSWAVIVPRSQTTLSPLGAEHPSGSATTGSSGGMTSSSCRASCRPGGRRGVRDDCRRGCRVADRHGRDSRQLELEVGARLDRRRGRRAVRRRVGVDLVVAGADQDLHLAHLELVVGDRDRPGRPGGELAGVGVRRVRGGAERAGDHADEDEAAGRLGDLSVLRRGEAQGRIECRRVTVVTHRRGDGDDVGRDGRVRRVADRHGQVRSGERTARRRAAERQRGHEKAE